MILVTGATGLLGTTLVPQLRAEGRNVATHSHKSPADHSANLAIARQAFELLDKTQPTTIINLVGLTSVERCQDKPNEAYLANTKTVENISDWISGAKQPCHLIQLSTDQVYDGAGPHKEDAVTITNSYAFSKYAGELAAARTPSTILRTNFVGRSSVSYRESLTDWIVNSLRLPKRIEVLQDVYFSPLSLTVTCEMISLAIDKQPLGIFNIGSRGGMSKADFDYAFAAALGLDVSLMTRINSADAAFLKAYRPKNMCMDCSLFEATMHVRMPDLSDLIPCLADEYRTDSHG